MQIKLILQHIVISAIIFFATNLMAKEGEQAPEVIARVQVSIISDLDGVVSLTVGGLTADGVSESKFKIADRGERYKLFVDGDSVWTWNSRIGYRLYQFRQNQEVVVFDPKTRGMKIPSQVRE
jgi:hypothetical protein